MLQSQRDRQQAGWPLWLAAWTATWVGGAAAVAEDARGPIPIGLEVGGRVPSFDVRDVTGPSAPTTLCYRCKYGARPVAAVFLRRPSPAAGRLLRKLDQALDKHANLRAFAVFLADDVDVAAAEIAGFAKDHELRLPLTAYAGAGGPTRLRLAREADVTVMLWARTRVVAGRAYRAGEWGDAEIDAILADLAKLRS